MRVILAPSMRSIKEMVAGAGSGMVGSGGRRSAWHAQPRMDHVGPPNLRDNLQTMPWGGTIQGKMTTTKTNRFSGTVENRTLYPNFVFLFKVEEPIAI